MNKKPTHGSMTKHRSNFIDLTDKKLGRLTVISEVERNKHGHTMWKCQCDCGNKKVIMGQSLRNGDTKSCGCLNKEIASKTHKDKFVSEETRRRMSEAHKGEKSYRWNSNINNEDRYNNLKYLDTLKQQ